MGRWAPDARGRLQQAAMELFTDRGYDQTTAADIAARAGLTERTYFRHFPDKREVLFGDSADLLDLMVAAAAGAPDDAAPLAAVAAALSAAADLMDSFGDQPFRRAAVVSAHAELRERELIKMAALAAALAGTLRDRGVAEPVATLTAEAGVTVFRVAFDRWVADPAGPGLAVVMADSLTQLRAALAPG